MTHPDPAGPAAADTIEFADPPVDLSDQTWSDGIVLVLFWMLAIIVFLQFFTRYVLNDSIAWTEEIARYFLIAVTFVGSVMAVRKQSHIAVEFLYRWLGRPARQALQALSTSSRSPSTPRSPSTRPSSPAAPSRRWSRSRCRSRSSTGRSRSASWR
jgi:hypothetical protein